MSRHRAAADGEEKQGSVEPWEGRHVKEGVLVGYCRRWLLCCFWLTRVCWNMVKPARERKCVGLLLSKVVVVMFWLTAVNFLWVFWCIVVFVSFCGSCQFIYGG